MADQAGKKYAYTTLITRANYLAGVIILGYTLKKHGSRYPLIVLYPDTLKQDAVRALELEAPRLNLILRKCDMLLPPKDVKTWLIAERFTDTWTKLRVFEVLGYDTLCYLDADMAIFNKNMDEVFELGETLPPDWIAASHACVCNKERDPWAPDEWREENCGFTPVSHPDALTKPTPVKPDSRPTYHLLNSGQFLYHPSQQLWDAMLHFFQTTPLLSQFKFPDQDFLAEFFRNKWSTVGWQYNALKTMRYWHENMWRDDEVICLHYIVDKPWAARVGEDGVAGYRGNDGVTHQWWWDQYEAWRQESLAGGDVDACSLVAKYVAKLPGESDCAEVDPDMQAIGANVQGFAKNEAPEEKEEDGGSHHSHFKHKVPGERGHGPVVRPHGSSKMIQ